MIIVLVRCSRTTTLGPGTNARHPYSSRLESISHSTFLSTVSPDQKVSSFFRRKRSWQSSSVQTSSVVCPLYIIQAKSILTPVIVQAAGAALVGRAASSEYSGESDSPLSYAQANNVLIAGLALQVATWVIFLVFLLVAMYRAFTLDCLKAPAHGKMRKMLWVILGTTLLILLRACYRLSESIYGKLLFKRDGHRANRTDKAKVDETDTQVSSPVHRPVKACSQLSNIFPVSLPYWPGQCFPPKHSSSTAQMGHHGDKGSVLMNRKCPKPRVE